MALFLETFPKPSYRDPLLPAQSQPPLTAAPSRTGSQSQSRSEPSHQPLPGQSLAREAQWGHRRPGPGWKRCRRRNRRDCGRLRSQGLSLCGYQCSFFWSQGRLGPGCHWPIRKYLEISLRSMADNYLP